MPQNKEDQQKSLLTHKPGKPHPIQTMRLGIFPISGKRSNREAFQNKRVNSFYAPGESPQKVNTIVTSTSGWPSAVTTLTPFDPTLPGC